MAQVRLPVVQADEGSLGKDGKRLTVHTADVKGRWVNRRRIVYALLIALWAALPWIKIAGRPAIFLDVAAREFYLFGAIFNAQDFWLVFFLVTGVGFGLVYLTAVAGRVWCGWGCPQTVFLDFVFRPIERLIQGSREHRIRRNAGPWTFDRVWRKALTHLVFFAVAFGIAHIVLAYFTSMPGLFRMVKGSPSEHPEAFGWAASMTAIFYLNFAFFREQVCVIVCPYGRLQSVLIDDDSLVVGYDDKRGEPRTKGKQKKEGAGDCVDCSRCVVVCPTGIDIRRGMQLDCIACTACIDACDDVMGKLGRPAGLIRYDSLRGLAGGKRRILRPRLVLYTVLLVIGAVVFFFSARRRTEFEANLLRLRGAPYALEGGVLRNSFEVHLVNKRGEPESFDVSVDVPPEATVVLPMKHVSLGPQANFHVPVIVTVPQDRFRGEFPVKVRVHRVGAPEKDALERAGQFLGAVR